jgi:hypothetical protein
MTDADALLLSLAQPIAVVGNGTIRRQHDAIEAHATVIRFNDYADVGYEPDVGHSIHVWCITCCGRVMPRNWRHPVRVMTIARPDEQPEHLPGWLALYGDLAVPTGESWIRAARALKTGVNPTTGLTLLLRLMHHGRKFTAFGFDGLRSGHYWDKDHRHTASHDDELPALMELARRGAIFA